MTAGAAAGCVYLLSDYGTADEVAGLLRAAVARIVPGVCDRRSEAAVLGLSVGDGVVVHDAVAAAGTVPADGSGARRREGAR